MSGLFSDTVDFDLSSGVFNLMSEGNDESNFLLKIDSDSGNFVWAKQITNSSINNIYQVIQAAPDGSLYLESRVNIVSNDYQQHLIENNDTITLIDSNYFNYLIKFGFCPPVEETDSFVVCDSLTWIDGNTYYSDTTDVHFMLTSINGCDSTVTLNLTIGNKILLTPEACDSFISPSGKIWNTSAIFLDTIKGGACDTFYVIDLNIIATSRDTLNIEACEQYSSPSGKLWQESNTYYDTILNQAGCDSLLVINLVIDTTPNIQFNGNSTICEGQTTMISVTGASSFIWDHSLETSSNIELSPQTTMFYLVEGMNGACVAKDSIEIEVLESLDISISATDTFICDQGTVIFSAHGATEYAWSHNLGVGSSVLALIDSTTTIEVIGETAGCFDTTFFEVTVFKSPVPPVFDDNGVLTTGIYQEYVWYKNGEIIQGVQQNTLNLSENGTYWVQIIDQNNCSGISDSVIINYLGEASISNIIQFNLSPNPGFGKYIMDLNLQNESNVSVRVFDVLGNQISSHKYGMKNRLYEVLDLGNLSSGIYLLELDLGNSKVVRKIVKN